MYIKVNLGLFFDDVLRTRKVFNNLKFIQLNYFNKIKRYD